LISATDIVVAQGTEAGGHGAARSTLALVPAVVDAVRERNNEVVVVAAGGIADGRGLAAASAEANDLDTSVVFAGECVDLIRDVKPAGAIVASLVHEAEAALKSNLSR
jgi:hypothetical protein